MVSCLVCGRPPVEDEYNFCGRCGGRIVPEPSRHLVREHSKGFLSSSDFAYIRELAEEERDIPEYYQKRLATLIERAFLQFRYIERWPAFDAAEIFHYLHSWTPEEDFSEYESIEDFPKELRERACSPAYVIAMLLDGGDVEMLEDLIQLGVWYSSNKDLEEITDIEISITIPEGET